jgi:hypothetical protein
MEETGSDPDLKTLRVSLNPGITEGAVTLSAPSGVGRIKLYADAARTTAVPLPKTWQAEDLAGHPVTLYVEGILVSNAARDVRLWLNYDGPDDETCVDTIRLTVLDWEINTVGFDSAHDPPMIDNNTDYEPTGPDFEEPEWFPAWTPPRNAPFSHTMDSNVTVKIITTLFPLDLPAMDFEFIGDGPQGFNFEETVSLHGGNNFPELTSTDVLERKIQKLSVDIDWALRRNGSTVIRQATGPHTAYITMGPPRDRNYPQHVVTIKRMERAVQEVEATGSLDPHTIVASVIAAQGTYDLDAFRDNAWTVPDFAINHRGDCATIVRYTKKVAFMTGVPGQFAHVLVYATDAAPETPIVTTGTDSLCNPWIPHNVNTTWKLQLEDGDGDNNCFEAAARFNYDNVELYYPGGIPGSSTGDPRDILHAFVGLSWYEFVPPWAFRERMYTYP